MVIEVVLTLALAGVIYLEGEMSSSLAVIQGNVLYESALKGLVAKEASWFDREFAVKLADRFNHVSAS